MLKIILSQTSEIRYNCFENRKFKRYLQRLDITLKEDSSSLFVDFPFDQVKSTKWHIYTHKITMNINEVCKVIFHVASVPGG